MSTTAQPPWQQVPSGVILHVHLQPRAARNRLVGLHGGALKIALTAPPVENAANTALLSFLATLLHLPRTSFALISGAKSREKRIRITCPEPQTLVRRLQEVCPAVDKKIRMVSVNSNLS